MKLLANPYIRRLFIALLSIWVGFFIYALLGSVSGMLTVHDYRFRLWTQLQGLTMYGWLPWVFLTPAALWFSGKVPIRPANWVLGVFVHLCLFLLLAILHGYMAAHTYYNSGHMTPDMVAYEPWQHTGHFLFLDDMFLFDALIYIFIVASQNITNFYSLVRQKELDALRMQGQLTESRLKALLMQVNPHFLFNTLNSIAVLVRKNETERANTMIEKLSAFFRHTLDAPAGQWVPLHQELDLMEQYLDIEKVRIGSRLVVHKSIPAAALGFPVPMLLIQPLVENAIRHGVGKKPGHCELRIDARLSDGLLILQITDTGAGCDFDRQQVGTGQAGTGIGLSNVRERLRQSYGNDHGLRLEGSVGSGVVVTLELPDVRAA